MALCTINQIQVSGTQDVGYPSIIGIYTVSGTVTVNGITCSKYLLDGGTEFNYIAPTASGPLQMQWAVQAPPFPDAPFSGAFFTSPLVNNALLPDCPSGLAYTGAPQYGSITVTAVAPDPYAPWGGFANWQRLRLLEYV